jgi:hypothetical protein
LIILKTSLRTSGFSQFKSGCFEEKMVIKYCPVCSSNCQAEPLKIDSQLFGSFPSTPSAQMYQSLFGFSLELLDSMNH